MFSITEQISHMVLTPAPNHGFLHEISYGRIQSFIQYHFENAFKDTLIIFTFSRSGMATMSLEDLYQVMIVV